MTLEGIDASSWQPSTPLDMAPDFVVARAGYSTTVDRMCDTHYQAAKRAGKRLGVYWYGGYHAGITGAQLEADAFVRNCQGYIGEALLALDWEAKYNVVWGNQAAERQWVRAFMVRVHELTQVWPVLYIQGSAVRRVYPGVSDICALWMAAYPAGPLTSHDQALNRSVPDYGGTVSMWQFTSSLGGGSLDGDVFYGDGAAWDKIATGERSGTASSAPSQPSVSKTVEQVANEVIAGQWGNQPHREQLLAAAGYVYADVQAKVNEIIAARHTAPTPTYTVKAGDNLSAIAAAHGTTWQAIYALNRSVIGSNPSLIKAGQVLTIG